MSEEESSARLWLVAHYDIHGNGAIVREGLSEDEARRMCDDFEARGHHQAYEAHAYTPATKQKLLVRERISP